MADIRKHFSKDIQELNPELFGEFKIETHAAFTEALRRSDVRTASNKFGAKKTKIGDLTFDSKKEAARYLELKGQEDRGEIKDLMLQCRINLLEGFTYQGQKVRAINYTADFVYMKGNVCYVEDVKSEATAKTEAFRIRWRLLQWHYKDVKDVVCLLTGA